jgi:hypothetical protein
MATPRNWLDTSGPMDTYAVIWSWVGLGPRAGAARMVEARRITQRNCGESKKTAGCTAINTSSWTTPTNNLNSPNPKSTCRVTNLNKVDCQLHLAFGTALGAEPHARHQGELQACCTEHCHHNHGTGQPSATGSRPKRYNTADAARELQQEQQYLQHRRDQQCST